MEKHRPAVEVAERHADGLTSDEELAAAKRSVQGDRIGKTNGLVQKAAAKASWRAVGAQTYYCHTEVSREVYDARRLAGVIGPDEASERPQQAGLLHEIVGTLVSRVINPIPEVVLAWNDRTLGRLAAEAYTERELPSGHLDLARLAVLSDALEEAGCTDEAILPHLRSPGPHVRVCWPVDLVLGKS